MRSKIEDYNAVVEAASKFTRSVAEDIPRLIVTQGEEPLLLLIWPSSMSRLRSLARMMRSKQNGGHCLTCHIWHLIIMTLCRMPSGFMLRLWKKVRKHSMTGLRSRRKECMSYPNRYVSNVPTYRICAAISLRSNKVIGKSVIYFYRIPS